MTRTVDPQALDLRQERPILVFRRILKAQFVCQDLLRPNLTALYRKSFKFRQETQTTVRGSISFSQPTTETTLDAAMSLVVFEAMMHFAEK